VRVPLLAPSTSLPHHHYHYHTTRPADYLPLSYDKWVTDRTFHKHIIACVDEDGKVLGIDTVGMFDGGETVMFQALRVHPQYVVAIVAVTLL
jgi:hypothetical protein